MRTSYALMWRIPVLLILCTMSASSIYFTAADALVPDWMSTCMINGLTYLFWQVDSLVVLTAIRLAPPNVEQVTATAAYPAYIPRPALPVVPITADSIRR
ncbi:hypothetical protein L596_001828 [Steinernema carpocapsae]|uniref:G-protein coupled receptors family 1 profile domain-containing protein n=1 Tax=Steinernema carpocapsae TaxID=34508 RepID=A0A4U8UNE6_STECR|nr:hypothetical protein L596_001828 [Steinernema carpocapsae]